MEKRKKLNATTILVLVVLALVAYIIYDTASERFERMKQDSFNAGSEAVIATIYNATNNCSAIQLNYGNLSKQVIDSNCINLFYNQGVTDVITSIMTAADNCSIVPLFVENTTIDLIDVNCV